MPPKTKENNAALSHLQITMSHSPKYDPQEIQIRLQIQIHKYALLGHLELLKLWFVQWNAKKVCQNF